MKDKSKKAFDCVEMKRKIQEEIMEETKGMTWDEEIAYYRGKAAGGLVDDQGGPVDES